MYCHKVRKTVPTKIQSAERTAVHLGLFFPGSEDEKAGSCGPKSASNSALFCRVKTDGVVWEVMTVHAGFSRR